MTIPVVMFSVNICCQCECHRPIDTFNQSRGLRLLCRREVMFSSPLDDFQFHRVRRECRTLIADDPSRTTVAEVDLFIQNRPLGHAEDVSVTATASTYFDR